MLTETELAAWYERLSFSESTRAVINQVRLSDPARRVGGGRCNVSGFYPSRKMGVTIQFESHRVELAAIYEMEHDPQTLEFYDQPNAIALDYKSANGRRQVVRHTPDFFVIRPDAAGWEEWKTEDELNRLAETARTDIGGRQAAGTVRQGRAMRASLASITASARPRKSIGGSSGMPSFLKTTCAPTPAAYRQLPLDESSRTRLHYPAFP
jgi:hypothetical protein